MPEQRSRFPELDAETMLEGIFRRSGVSDPVSIQSTADKVRLCSEMDSGKTRSYLRMVDGVETEVDLPYREKVIIGEYDHLEDLYAEVEAEKERDAKARKPAELPEYLADLALQGAKPEPIPLPIIPELEAFRRDVVSADAVLQAAKETVAYREQTGLDESVLVCAQCRDKEDVDDGGHPMNCECCNGDRTIVKYPEIIVADALTGREATLNVDVATLLAAGQIALKKTTDEQAFSSGSVMYWEKLLITTGDSVKKQVASLGVDPDAFAVIANNRVHDSYPLTMDLSVTSNLWKRFANSPEGYPGEVTANRRPLYRPGMLGYGKSTDYTAHDVLFAAQYQLSECLSSIFSKDGRTHLPSQRLELLRLKPLSESLEELRRSAVKTGSNLSYSGHYSNFLGETYFVASLSDATGEIVRPLAFNYDSPRMAIENAKLALAQA